MSTVLNAETLATEPAPRKRRRKAKRAQLHPLLKEVARRQREIFKLLEAARMIGVDVSPVLPKPSHMTRVERAMRDPKRRADYYRELADAMYAPAPGNPLPVDLIGADSVGPGDQGTA